MIVRYNMCMRKLLVIFALTALLIPLLAAAQVPKNNEATLYFFYSPTCSVCAKEKVFLDELQEHYPDLIVESYSFHSSEGKNLLKTFLEDHGAERFYGSVPMTFIGNEFFPGFDESTGIGIEAAVAATIELPAQPEPPELPDGDNGATIRLPFVGEFDTARYSLPVLAVILGTLDGFNVCSLGALVLILGLVLALRSRRKILIYGGVFILTTAVVYGLLIMLWYQLFGFVSSYLILLQLLIVVVGIGGGVYFFREFARFRKYGPTCDDGIGGKISTRFSSRIRNALDKPGNILAILGSVLLFAAVITVVEFPCSAAVPVVFAGILASHGLSVGSHLIYIAIFLLFYLLDELIIFALAVWKLNVWCTTSPKFITWATFVEAVVLTGIGLYYFITLL